MTATHVAEATPSTHLSLFAADELRRTRPALRYDAVDHKWPHGPERHGSKTAARSVPPLAEDILRSQHWLVAQHTVPFLSSFCSVPRQPWQYRGLLSLSYLIAEQRFLPGKRMGLPSALSHSAVKVAQPVSICRQRKCTVCPCLHSS